MGGLGEREVILMENLQKFFKNKKVLITGHTGFKGSWLTEVLLSWGARVAGVALRPSTKPNLFEVLALKKRIRNYFIDVRDFEKIKRIFLLEKPEIVFHLAAQAIVRDSYDDPLYTFETNIMGTANVLQAAREAKTVRAVILATTDKVYSNKENNHRYRENDGLGGYCDPYSGSKAAAEMIISSYINSFFNPKERGRKHRTLLASVRSGNVIGGGDWGRERLIPDVVRAVFHGNRKVTIRNPESVRPWQYVLEPLRGYLILAKKLYEGKAVFSGAWNFGPTESGHLTVRKLIERTLKLLGRGSYVVKPDASSKVESHLLKLDNAKARKLLRWTPTLSINEALAWTMQWYSDFYQGEDIRKISKQQIKSFFN